MILLPDTSLVWNFHVLGRLNLVRNLRDSPIHKDAGWAWSIRDEVGDRIPGALDQLADIFGEHTTPTDAQRVTTATIKANIFRQDGDDPRKHTGESETIAIWSEVAPISTPLLFLTEDVDLVRFCWRTHDPSSHQSRLAGGRKFTPVTTADVLDSAIKRKDLSSQEGSQAQATLRHEKRPYIGNSMLYRHNDSDRQDRSD